MESVEDYKREIAELKQGLADREGQIEDLMQQLDKIPQNVHHPEECYITYQNPGICEELMEYLLNSGLICTILQSCKSHIEQLIYDDKDFELHCPEDGTQEEIEFVKKFITLIVT